MSTLNYVVSMLAELELPPGEVIPPGIDPADLSDAEARIGFRLPSDFRTWLLTTNGPCVGPGGVVGIGNSRKLQDLEFIYDLYPSWQEKHWVPIAGDGCGGYYVLQPGKLATTPVVFVDANGDTDEPAFVVGSDLWRFLAFLFRKDLGQSRWPFDKNEVIAADPQILDTAIVLPGDA